MTTKRGGGVVGMVDGRKAERWRGLQKSRVSGGERKAGDIARRRAAAAEQDGEDGAGMQLGSGVGEKEIQHNFR